MKIIAGDNYMGIQPILPDDIRGEQQVLPRVKGLLLGVDPFRGNTHGHQLTGGAAALRHRLIAVVPSAGGDADRVGMGGQVFIGGFDAVLQHHAGAAIVHLTPQQHHSIRRIIAGGPVGGGKAHNSQHRQRHGQHQPHAGQQHRLQPFGKAAEEAGEEAPSRRQQQQRRRPEHADMAYADGQRHQEIDRSQQRERAKDG